jgi:hypothetical protein
MPEIFDCATHRLLIGHNQAVNVRNIEGYKIPVAYISLKLVSGRYLGLTYKDM